MIFFFSVFVAIVFVLFCFFLLLLKIDDNLGRSVVTMAQFDSDNLRIARPSEVLSNIKVRFSFQYLSNFNIKGTIIFLIVLCFYWGYTMPHQ